MWAFWCYNADTVDSGLHRKVVSGKAEPQVPRNGLHKVLDNRGRVSLSSFRTIGSLITLFRKFARWGSIFINYNVFVDNRAMCLIESDPHPEGRRLTVTRRAERSSVAFSGFDSELRLYINSLLVSSYLGWRS